MALLPHPIDNEIHYPAQHKEVSLHHLTRECCHSDHCCLDHYRHQPSPLQRGRRVNWREISASYPEPRECLAAFIALGAAEVLSGVKPANLLRVSRHTRACGRNMYQLWQKFGAEILTSSPLTTHTLRDNDAGLLVLIYNPTLLHRRLDSLSATTFLRTLGYRQSCSMEQTLSHLEERFGAIEIPHEVGVFLGYPLKDVTAFIGHRNLKVSAQRLWKIYGHSRRSEQLADLYQHHHLQIAHQLHQQGTSAFRLLQCA